MPFTSHPIFQCLSVLVCTVKTIDGFMFAGITYCLLLVFCRHLVACDYFSPWWHSYPKFNHPPLLPVGRQRSFPLTAFLFLSVVPFLYDFSFLSLLLIPVRDRTDFLCHLSLPPKLQWWFKVPQPCSPIIVRESTPQKNGTK